MTIPRPDAEIPVHCLLVDDREENLLALRALLRAPGVDLLEARSGREALELLLVHDVALVLMDVQMPEMDGFEVVELMRGSERTRDVPVIFITAGASDAARVFRGYDRGAVDFLHKPVDPAILRNKVAVFFELYRRREGLRRQLAEREQSLRLNEMFMAVLGHDLRSPLHAIGLGAEMLQRASADAMVGEIAGRILSSSGHMASMIEDLLDVARARQSGGLPVDRQATDLGAIVGRVVEDQRLASPGRELSVELTGSLVGDWDESRLRQLVGNLIGNAIRHGAPGEPVRVRLDGSAAPLLRLEVANGGDIPQELLATLFDPFSGSDRHGGRRQGLGLGLYIADQIVRAHDGSIAVVSGAADGVVVTVHLPRWDPQPRDALRFGRPRHCIAHPE